MENGLRSGVIVSSTNAGFAYLLGRHCALALASCGRLRGLQFNISTNCATCMANLILVYSCPGLDAARYRGSLMSGSVRFHGLRAALVEVEGRVELVLPRRQFIHPGTRARRYFPAPGIRILMPGATDGRQALRILT